MENKENRNLRIFKIVSYKALAELESQFRDEDPLNSMEFQPYAEEASYETIAKMIMPDKDVDAGLIAPAEDHWKNPLYLVRATVDVALEANEVGQKAIDYLKKHYKMYDESREIDLLSLTTIIEGEKIVLLCLVRSYIEKEFDFTGFFDHIGEKIVSKNAAIEEKAPIVSGRLILSDEVKNFSYSPDELKRHDELLRSQQLAFDTATDEKPFLNSLTHYERKILPTPADVTPGTYDLAGYNSQLKIVGEYKDFEKIFYEIMNYVSTMGFFDYINVLGKSRYEAREATENYLESLKERIELDYIQTGKLKKENMSAMLKKLRRSLFQLYIVQDLIDDPNITDIRIVAPDDISVRVNGRRYLANVSFIDLNDYARFFTFLYERNHLDKTYPKQTCVYKFDEEYLLRFTIYAGYVSANDLPLLHIRKEPRVKLTRRELIAKKFMTDVVADYICDLARQKGGIAWVGKPGSGKTVGLNWMLEDGYEQEADILIIQENDELFTGKKGVMCQHVVEYDTDITQSVDLEELGRMALVAGANVFIVGETKGPEVCASLTLGSSGCRISTTLHSSSAEEGWYKIANLAMKGNYTDFDLAMEDAVKCFKTMIYCEDFSVKEIVQAIGYDRTTHKIDYRYIYRKE